jgi:hypothetical protein
VRSTELFGAFTVTVNASETVTVIIYDNGTSIFTKSGTHVFYSGTIGQADILSITVQNSETGVIKYSLGIDFAS